MSHARRDRPTSHFAALLLPLILAATVLGCHSGGSEDLGGPVAVIADPTVISTTPAGGATGVAVSTAITATFSEEMLLSSITSATFTVSGPGGTLPGTVTYDATTSVARFTPTGGLAAGTTCVGTITTGAMDLTGHALATAKVWSFTTAAVGDTVAPTVTSTVPSAGATGVAVNTSVSATFSEAMNASTITGSTFTLRGPGASLVSGSVTYAGASHVATFTPTNPLIPSTTYSATIATGVRDVAGNALATSKTWSFTTGTVADTIPPTVISTVPAAGAAGVPVNTTISATFSEPMNASTLTGATFSVQGPGASPLAGAVAYDAPSRVATFTPTSALAAGTTYMATITTGARDAAGNGLATNKTWSFTTGTVADTVAPTVTSTIPADAATGVPVNTAIRATFSEAMNASTITTATFTVRGPGATPVAGTVSYDAPSRVATFTPTSTLAGSTAHTATISTAAKDVAGNSLASDKSWSFTTEAAADTVAPTVTSTVPAPGTPAVPVNTTVSATFSEAMDPTTINGTTFTLRGPGAVQVAGMVAYDMASHVATFTPASNLAASSTYTATITTGARDVAGNALAANKTWSFTTGTMTDTNAPSVISTMPSDGAVGVAVGTTISATFSEPMNATTITGATFMVRGPGATPVAGNVSYDAPSHVATFTPASSLMASTTYMATITTGARDVAGNGLATNKVWSFRTANQPSVFLGALGPFAVIAGSTVTNTGATIVTGDLGVSPGTAVTGFPPGIVTGTIHAGDPAAATAKSALDTAYNDAAGRNNSPITIAGNLGGQTLTPGLYKSTSSLEISSGDLTLDAQGDSSAVFIFQMASTLTTTPGRAVILSGGAQAGNIYWQVGSSATIGVGSMFKGTILSDQSITLNTGASLVGRAVTRIGAVTLADNAITVP